MKILPLVVLVSAFLAVPATAAESHGTTLTHQGSTFSVSYEPTTKTSLHQTGLGPRGSAACIWTTKTYVERKLTAPSGRPIEALTRSVGEPKTSEGIQPGYCTHVQPNRVAMFGGNSDDMQAFLAQVAASDKDSLNAELVSVGTLGRQVSRGL